MKEETYMECSGFTIIRKYSLLHREYYGIMKRDLYISVIVGKNPRKFKKAFKKAVGHYLLEDYLT